MFRWNMPQQKAPAANILLFEFLLLIYPICASAANYF